LAADASVRDRGVNAAPPSAANTSDADSKPTRAPDTPAAAATAARRLPAMPPALDSTAAASPPRNRSANVMTTADAGMVGADENVAVALALRVAENVWLGDAVDSDEWVALALLL
jgi:hypothetical protein